jgi:hypothetical protein
MRRFLFLCAIGCTALLSSAVVAQQGAAPAKPAPKAAAATSAPRQPLYNMTNSLQDIMEGVVAPAADTLFDAVATDITAAGVTEKRPQTDEEWEHVEAAAIALVESMNMIKVPGRPVARPGEPTKSEGPDAPELTAEEITAKINANRALFLKYANALQTHAIRTLAIVRKHDVQGLFDIGEDLDEACENCHLEYWYPNDKAAKAAADANRKLREAEEKQKKLQGK